MADITISAKINLLYWIPLYNAKVAGWLAGLVKHLFREKFWLYCKYYRLGKLSLIERLHVTSPPIVTNVKFHVKLTSVWQARLVNKCVPYSNHSYSSSRFSVQTGASPLGLYYRYASLWKITKVALQNERSSLNLPCGSEDLVMSSQLLYYLGTRCGVMSSKTWT